MLGCQTEARKRFVLSGSAAWDAALCGTRSVSQVLASSGPLPEPTEPAPTDKERDLSSAAQALRSRCDVLTREKLAYSNHRGNGFVQVKPECDLISHCTALSLPKALKSTRVTKRRHRVVSWA